MAIKREGNTQSDNKITIENGRESRYSIEIMVDDEPENDETIDIKLESATNAGWFITESEIQPLPMGEKLALSHQLWSKLLSKLNGR